MGTETETRAIGQRGVLIRSLDGAVLFRVYDHLGDFVDYDITHYDCEIVVIDPSAALITNSQGAFLDYTAESMSLTKETK